MINRDEINEKAAEFKIYPTDVEKDYVYGWLLSRIFASSRLGSSMILKGGNAIRKGYLLHSRFSKDLDFSVEHEIDPASFAAQLNTICQEVSDQTGVNFLFDKTKLGVIDIPAVENKIFEARIYFKGFYNEENITLKAQLDLTQFDKIYLPIQSRNLIHPYSDESKCQTQIKCQKFEEIIASKLNTLLVRRKVSDLFDLFFSTIFTKELHINRLELIKTFLKKTIYESNPIIAKQLLIDIPLNEFESNWETLTVPNSIRLKFGDIKDNYSILINELFDLVASQTYQPINQGLGTPALNPIYFSSDVRNTIINSGKNRTLLQLFYDGHTRLIEPYSFRYNLRKKDGVSVEYFFGYDTTGGKSGRTGIKCFLMDKIGSVQLTKIKYTPRWAIEF